MFVLYHLAKDWIGEVEVSTIYVASAIPGVVEPMAYYETMVFGGPLDGTQVRCPTLAEAYTQHAAVRARVEEKG